MKYSKQSFLALTGRIFFAIPLLKESLVGWINVKLAGMTHI